MRSLDERPWLRRIVDRLKGESAGIRLRMIDEPVAAALGYGVDVGRARTIVAFDFGAGTMEAAVVRIPDEGAAESGKAEVLAKEGLKLGGDDVDGRQARGRARRPQSQTSQYSPALRIGR